MKLLLVYTRSKGAQLSPLVGALRERGAECAAVCRDEFLDGFARSGRAGRLGKLLDSLRPDALLLDAPGPLWRQASRRGIPFAVFFWDYETDSRLEAREPGPRARRLLAGPRRRKLVRECVESASAVLAENGAMASAIRKSYPSCRVETAMYSCIDAGYWRGRAKREGRPRVGFLQDARRWRKVDELAEVMPRVADALPAVSFCWAGGGRFAGRVAQALGGRDNFEVLGRLGYPGPVRDFLGSLDVYGLACSMDMSPYSLKAAQSMELPVVATAAGGVPGTMVDGRTGVLVEPGDAEGWVRAISSILADAGRAREMGRRGRRFAVAEADSGPVSARLLEILEAMR